MTIKADFTVEEWSQLRQAPPLAGLYALVAEPGGTIAKTLSMAEVYGDVQERWWGPNHPEGLVDEIAGEGPEFDRARFGSLPSDIDVDAVKGEGLEQLRAAVTMLRGKATPHEVAEYQRFVSGISQRVANAHKEGGFLGLGGTRVSAKERAALGEIEAALGLVVPAAV
ncbi:MAG: hypothetical protein QOF76_5003 [Solirubrobacteraceae bacterium]|nr:hypothetical protein [Solirubrobacteraceae bacterium]